MINADGKGTGKSFTQIENMTTKEKMMLNLYGKYCKIVKAEIAVEKNEA